MKYGVQGAESVLWSVELRSVADELADWLVISPSIRHSYITSSVGEGCVEDFDLQHWADRNVSRFSDVRYLDKADLVMGVTERIVLKWSRLIARVRQMMLLLPALGLGHSEFDPAPHDRDKGNFTRDVKTYESFG